MTAEDSGGEVATAGSTPVAGAWQPPEIRAVAASIAGTSAGAMPAFLTGAIAVQLIDEIGLDARTLGLCLGGYFTTAAAGSAVLGRLAERLGPAAAMRLAVGLALVVSLLLAVLTRSTATLGGLLLLGGLSNAFTQPSANLLLVERVRPERLGFAFALKQAGMPVASLVGGLLVPTIALTVGWRWTYVVAAGIAATALLVLGRPSASSASARSAPVDGAGRTAGAELGGNAPPDQGVQQQQRQGQIRLVGGHRHQSDRYLHRGRPWAGRGWGHRRRLRLSGAVAGGSRRLADGLGAGHLAPDPPAGPPALRHGLRTRNGEPAPGSPFRSVRLLLRPRGRHTHAASKSLMTSPAWSRTALTARLTRRRAASAVTPSSSPTSR